MGTAAKPKPRELAVGLRGSLTLNKRNQASCPATDAAQRTRHTLGGVGDGRAGGRRDARQAL